MPIDRSRLKKAGKWTAAGAAAIAMVGVFEGVRTKAYYDVVGIPTVCFGETRGVKITDRYTVAECKVKLGNALVEFEQGVRAGLKNPDAIPDSVYVSSLSLAYNIGTGAFRKSSVARYINAGKWKEACNAIPRFNKAGGRVIKGLVNRREAEKKYCLAGI